ncbi:bestrophin family protein [Galbibacter pacificus]|uniref:Bestrophin family ion channel n=1 Tax=Galbibacter pacificus TaxID=2996052 RepID=A0ABT6FRU6_9FLAO|nr:bestrophin family ion channel [Galbibacter pacificus]MDG3582887.1 bestrophin family ion channel [Galbibacter pacificus]MDG3585994.1 bestrophin family ion channel [Galbibacter pacificus]
MNTGSHYKIHHFIPWTRRNIFRLLIIATIPTVIYAIFDIDWIAIPWTIIGLVGIGATFITGFRNTQTYNRLWEARMIWGAIVNDSRTWGVMVKDFIVGGNKTEENEDIKAIHKRLVYRHIAWLTALRHQLRKPQAWENQNKPYFKEYLKHYKVPEWETSIQDDLKPYLSQQDLNYVMAKKNRATQVLSLQSADLKRIRQQRLIEAYPYVSIEVMLKDFFTHQGKAERIKNFPYPRQFTSISLYFIWLLVILIPFGLLEPLSKLGEYGVWLNIPFSVIVGWVFTSLEQVGESTENPFEGGANDIPMAALSRTIEIDLREMLEETNLPPAAEAINKILM